MKIKRRAFIKTSVIGAGGLMLASRLAAADQAVPKAVAVHDLGQFIVHHPNGKKFIARLF